MRCLMCMKPIRRDSFSDLFRREDVLCEKCRDTWKRIGRRFKFEGYSAYALYAYEGGFSECLLQYKELCDEALKPAFLYPDVQRLRHMYHGRTVLLMPSSAEALKQRGFSHLHGIFESLGLPMIEPFEKISGSSQKRLGKAERALMKTNLRLKENVSLPHKILLADDVITTGSTMKGALSVLPEDLDIRIFSCGFTEPKEMNRNTGILRR